MSLTGNTSWKSIDEKHFSNLRQVPFNYPSPQRPQVKFDQQSSPMKKYLQYQQRKSSPRIKMEVKAYSEQYALIERKAQELQLKVENLESEKGILLQEKYELQRSLKQKDTKIHELLKEIKNLNNKNEMISSQSQLLKITKHQYEQKLQCIEQTVKDKYLAETCKIQIEKCRISQEYDNLYRLGKQCYFTYLNQTPVIVQLMSKLDVMNERFKQLQLDFDQTYKKYGQLLKRYYGAVQLFENIFQHISTSQSKIASAYQKQSEQIRSLQRIILQMSTHSQQSLISI